MARVLFIAGARQVLTFVHTRRVNKAPSHAPADRQAVQTGWRAHSRPNRDYDDPAPAAARPSAYPFPRLYVVGMRTWTRDLEAVHALTQSRRYLEAEAILREAIDGCTAEQATRRAGAIARAISILPADRQGDLWKMHVMSMTGLRETVEAPPGMVNTGASDENASTVLRAASEQLVDGQRYAYEQRVIDQAVIGKTITEVRALLSRVRPSEAQQIATDLIDSMRDDEVRQNLNQLQELADAFHPKRQRALTQRIEYKLASAHQATNPRTTRKIDTEDQLHQLADADADADADASVERKRRFITGGEDRSPATEGSPSRSPVASQSVNDTSTIDRLLVLRQRFMAELDDLSRYHIFQWATYYRSTLLDYFGLFLDDIASHSDDASATLDVVRACLMNHAREVFTKGYNYSTRNGVDEESAYLKSLSGLQRFLDLPVEFYLAELQLGPDSNHARALRGLCSAMICGILRGYAFAKFNEDGAPSILSEYSRSWAFVIPFMTASDISEFAYAMQPGDFMNGVHDSVRPLAEAIDRLLEDDPTSAPLPTRALYSHASRRIDVTLQLPALDSHQFDIQCFLSEQFVGVPDLENAVSRAILIVVAPLRADVRAHVQSVDRLASIVVSTIGGVTEDVSARLRAKLSALAHRHDSASIDQRIEYNYAAEFPLEEPEMLKYNLVYRGSVRQLMRTHERHSGIRLWCSVRRSGKTTASLKDLGPASNRSVVVTQTCERTSQPSERGEFYAEIQRALEAGKRLPDNFVTLAVRRCLPTAGEIDSHIVLVLDEYETLFGDLATSLEDTPALRYSVVQPLLNQLVAFARDNLLVLMGQQPDAHFILLDQNQLSPLVQQDSFPLFPHDASSPSSGEFYELMTKIMTKHVKLDSDFVTLVHNETAGHPFLTVQLMRFFMAWLIEGRRSMSALSPIRPELLVEFTDSQLTRKKIAMTDHFRLFTNAAAQHLSAKGREKDPWLAAVYHALRTLALDSPDSLSLGLDDFVTVAPGFDENAAGYNLLATGARANFFAFDDHCFGPRIPLLAKIAASVAQA